MIIVKLIGGLGNQMFQYALGRNLAEKNKTELKLDLTGFKTYKLHKYSLSYFNIIEKIAADEEIKPYKKYDSQTKTGKFFNLIESLKPLKFRTYVKEPYFFGYFPEVLNLRDGIYLDGYWQSEKYFKPIESILRRELTVKEELDADLLQAITASRAVSVHIRRTDYVTNPRAFKVHGICSIDYYNQAVNKMKQMVSQPHFFIFSDDINWAKENLNLGSPATFVEHGADKNYEDLALMSKCQHNIIANSSFSWWGAWLNNNPEKIIIAPQKWIKESSKDKRGLILKSWIAI